jgi:hypothetical protein
MNERIRQLAEQVGAVQNVLAMGRHDGVLFTETELEKFAELIVRECMSVADFPKNLTGQWDHLESSEVIAAHFGLDK